MTNISTKKTPELKAPPEKFDKKARISRHPKITKKAKLINMLGQKNGVNAAVISKRLGWLPHTTRAALSGLRKAGYEINVVKPGKGKPPRYQITDVLEQKAA